MSHISELMAQLSITGEIGQKLDVKLQEAQTNASRLEGAASYVKQGAETSIGSIIKKVKDDLENGHLEESYTGMELASKINSYLVLASDATLNFSKTLKSQSIGASGIAEGLKKSIEHIQRYHNVSKALIEQEHAKAEELLKEAASGTKSPKKTKKVSGKHPGPSKAQERIRKAKKKSVS